MRHVLINKAIYVLNVLMGIKLRLLMILNINVKLMYAQLRNVLYVIKIIIFVINVLHKGNFIMRHLISANKCQNVHYKIANSV